MGNIISIDFINFLIEKDLEKFKKNFNEPLISYSQDICSLSIAWLCYFFKEKVSMRNRLIIEEFVINSINSKNYNHFGWYRIPGLLAAIYVLAGNDFYLKELLSNISCGQSLHRIHIIECISIITPVISFNNKILRTGVEFNIKSNYDFADESILLLMKTTGDWGTKKEWITEQLKLERNNSSELLEKLKEDDAVIENNFFMKIFNDIKSHILFRILNHTYKIDAQYKIFEGGLPIITIEEQMDNHPLDKSSFKFNQLEDYR